MTDLEIAQNAHKLQINAIAAKLNIKDSDLTLYGSDKAKINQDYSKDEVSADRKLILMTAINPTPAGEGKTTVMIGLSDAMNQLNHQTTVAMREPSMGPVFGRKGGATGGGYSQVVPMVDINLAFTGDFPAITNANNLIAAMIDNEIFQGNPLNIDPDNVTFKRCLDVNDRTLRHMTGKNGEKVEFQITAASEIMAVLCLATNFSDLKKRIGQITVGYTYDHQPITVADLKITDAVSLILEEAIKPNLVQTLANNPVIIHGGPFANIAHGCNSVIATKTALSLSDFTVTEAGFGSDLGAEKFFDIKTPVLGQTPDTVVLVATVRALKYNGGQELKNLQTEDLSALQQGIPNLFHHIKNIQQFGIDPIVAINKFVTDTDAEIDFIKKECQKIGIQAIDCDPYNQGGKGCLDLADAVVKDTQIEKNVQLIIDDKSPLLDKLNTIVQKIYGGFGVKLTENAEKQLKNLQQLELDHLPVCIAKTPVSFSDNPKLLGNPTGFTVTINDLTAKTGAGFIVAQSGNIITLPGLPKHPAALNIHFDQSGDITGLS